MMRFALANSTTTTSNSMISTTIISENSISGSSNSLLYLRPEVAALKVTLERFVSEECIPAEAPYDAHISSRHGIQHRWTMDAIPPCIELLKQRAKELGLWNLFLPRHLRQKLPSELLGSGRIIPPIALSYREYGIFCEILGRCTPIAAEVCNCNAPDTGNMEVLLEFGTLSQQHQYLIPLLRGTIRSTFCMTEPNVASSDPTNLETKLTKVAIPKKQQLDRNTRGTGTDDTVDYDYEYRLTGTKWWSTGAMDPRCRCAFVVAKMDYTHPSLLPSATRAPTATATTSAKAQSHQAHTIVIVPLPHPQVQMVRPLTVFGYDDAPHGHAEVRFNHVTVPADAIVLGESYGFHISQARLGPGRIHHCMRAVGMASRCYELMIQRCLERQTFGKYLWEHGGVQEMIADSFADIEAARLLTLSCADTMDRVGVKQARQQIAMIKVMVPKLTYNVVDRAVQIFGGAGVGNDTILARSLVGLRTLRIADGPDAVHQRTVARLEVQHMKDQSKKNHHSKSNMSMQSRL